MLKHLATLRSLTLLTLTIFSSLPIPATIANPRDRLTRKLHVGLGALRGSAAPATPSGNFPDALPRYHNGRDLICSDCHIAHASQSHARNDGSGFEVPWPFTGAPNPNLMRNNDPLDLCLSCHDGQSYAPDVMGYDSARLLQRSAGFFGEPDVINPNGHDLGHGVDTRSDFGVCGRCHFSTPDQMKVTCVDCHDPHGNGVARNLRWASDPEGTPDLGLFTNPLATGMARYEARNVSFGTLSSDQLREASNMCLDCHHVFSGGSYVGPDHRGDFVRHPTFDSERNSLNTIAQGGPRETTAPAHWEDGQGSGFNGTERVRFVNLNSTNYAAATPVDATTNGVFCLSCHRVHGSDRPFGLVFPTSPNGSGPVGCDQCHAKSGP